VERPPKVEAMLRANPGGKEYCLSIDVESLKAEREQMRERLREVENEQRLLEGQQKKLRQKEIQTKRTLEALDTLIDINTVVPEEVAAPAGN
jgi:hypothetical protein